jgi:hypothetical protein
VELYVNDRLVAAEQGDDLHPLVSRMCDLAAREGHPSIGVDEDRSVLSVYVTEEDLRRDCGFALEVHQLMQLAEARIPFNLVFVET